MEDFCSNQFVQPCLECQLIRIILNKYERCDPVVHLLGLGKPYGLLAECILLYLVCKSLCEICTSVTLFVNSEFSTFHCFAYDCSEKAKATPWWQHHDSSFFWSVFIVIVFNSLSIVSKYACLLNNTSTFGITVAAPRSHWGYENLKNAS